MLLIIGDKKISFQFPIFYIGPLKIVNY